MATDTKGTLTVDELLRLAREDLDRSSLGSAEKFLEQAVLMNNQVADTFYLLGQVYVKKGKFKKAALAFERATVLDPFHTDAAIALSGLFNDLGRYREGAEVFSRTKRRLGSHQPGHDPRINQGLSEQHYQLGLSYVRFERFQEAHHEFTKALNLSPDNHTYAIQMAKCLSKSGDKEGAADLLRKTLQKSPKNVDAKVQMGVLHWSTGKLNEAHREWIEALSIDPNHKAAQMYLNMYESKSSSSAAPPPIPS